MTKLFSITLILLLITLSCPTALISEEAPFEWAVRAGGPLEDRAHAIAVDSDGYSYITGYFRDTAYFGDIELTAPGSFNIFIAKIDPFGNFIWVKKAGGQNINDMSIAEDIVLDDHGNIYITGLFQGIGHFGNHIIESGGLNDIFISKLDNNGNFLWAQGAGGQTNLNDAGSAITVDHNGNIYATGNFRGTAQFGDFEVTSSGGADIYLAKLNNHGEFLWVQRAGGPSNCDGWAVAVDNEGNCYLAGSFRGTFEIGDQQFETIGTVDTFIAKYDINGSLQWVNHAGGALNEDIFDITIDSNGYIYAVGHFRDDITFDDTIYHSIGSNDVFIFKMDHNGNFEWIRTAGGPSFNVGYSIALDHNGSIYTTGYYYESISFGDIELVSEGNRDIFLAKHDNQGNFLWALSAGGTLYEEGYGIDTDSDGNPYITGFFYGNAHFGDITLTADGDFGDIFIAKVYDPEDEQYFTDASIQSGDISFNPEYPQIGDTVTINARIHNIGEIDIDHGNALFSYQYGLSDNIFAIDQVNFGEIQAGSYIDISIDWDTNQLPAGIYIIIINLQNVFPVEQNLNNNSASRSVSLEYSIDITPVYRFFNHVKGGHLYTICEHERETVLGLSQWNYEGHVFNVLLENIPGSKQAYRFFNTITGIHLYTISEHERDTIKELSEWNYEGPAFYVFEVQEHGGIPVFRFFNHNQGGHLYTICEYERDTVLQLNDWTYEGICFYVIPL